MEEIILEGSFKHIGGGSKHKYRIIDFYRKKKNIAGTVERIEYDPNRTAYIALLISRQEILHNLSSRPKREI